MIRRATPADRPEILEIYSRARQFMRETGNPTQWGDTYPSEEMVDEDIAMGYSHVYESNGRIQAVFARIPWDDPTYQVILGGWLNYRPYWAVHRVASRGEEKGAAARCLDWCVEQSGNVRIDTHDDNLPMQRMLARIGFIKCGRIWLENGDPRIAYQKTK